MKKLVISALCGLCLFGAFACVASQPNEGNTVALSRSQLGITS